eukprot:gene10539-2666_t
MEDGWMDGWMDRWMDGWHTQEGLTVRSLLQPAAAALPTANYHAGVYMILGERTFARVVTVGGVRVRFQVLRTPESKDGDGVSAVDIAKVFKTVNVAIVEALWSSYTQSKQFRSSGCCQSIVKSWHVYICSNVDDEGSTSNLRS